MPRRKTTFSQGHIYHIYNRGANRERIFFNQENHLYCLRLMKKYFRRYQIAIIAYCLMPNHYHFLLRQDGEVALSRVVGWLFNAYVLAVNN
jgi:REP element-mobilizing transposase RayT